MHCSKSGCRGGPRKGAAKPPPICSSEGYISPGSAALAWLGAEELLVLALHVLVFVSIGGRFALAGDIGPTAVAVFPVDFEPGFGLGVGIGQDRLGRALGWW